MSYTLIMDQRVHRTVVFNSTLTDGSTGTTIVVSVAGSAASLAVTTNGVTRNVLCPGITTLQNRIYIIKYCGDGQVLVQTNTPDQYGLFMEGMELSSDPTFSIVVVNKPYPDPDSDLSDVFVITDSTKATQTNVPAGGGVKVPPGVGILSLDQLFEK